MFIISVYLEWVKCDECSCECGHVSEVIRNGVVIPILLLLSAIFFFFLLVYHDAGSNDVMGDREYECREKTDLALREERLHGDVDMTV